VSQNMISGFAGSLGIRVHHIGPACRGSGLLSGLLSGPLSGPLVAHYLFPYDII
jgi:hypothetical protein